MMDGGTDCSIKELELIYCRFLDNGYSVNAYFEVAAFQHANADGIYTALESSFQVHGLEDWIDKVISAGMDGESVDLGRNNSVATRLHADEHDYLLPIHCIAHNLELGVYDALKKVDTLNTCMDMLHKMHL